MHESLPLSLLIPFVGMLLSIALLPLVAPHAWESLRRKAIVSALFGLPIAVFMLLQAQQELFHVLHEYVSFICLLGSLFVISGGILVTGDLKATPLVNTTFLLVGALIANIVGTTGASMLLLRPLLRTNEERVHVLHIPIFFIFLVSNIGGCLTPLGDPPLFLGFLRGVPFTWTFQLWPEWLLMVSATLAIFYVIDSTRFRQEPRLSIILDRVRQEPLRIRGEANFLAFAGVLAAVLWLPTPWREVAMIVLSVVSFVATPKTLHERNRFTFYPIQEVAILFIGIFVTMAPALMILEAKGDALGVRTPAQFFWATGILSSFLDNAPTYLSFSSVALGVFHIPAESGQALLTLSSHPEGTLVLRGISLGAVFMGAMTYIGNGPNFMVKSICEERGIRMPSFLGYMLWSIGILVPLLVLVDLLFLRG